MRQDECPLCMGKCSLIIREMNNKTTMRYHSLPSGGQKFLSLRVSSNSKMWNNDGLVNTPYIANRNHSPLYLSLGIQYAITQQHSTWAHPTTQPLHSQMHRQEKLVHMFTRQHGREYSKQHCSSKQNNPNIHKEENA